VIANERGNERSGASSMSRGADPERGHNVPSDPEYGRALSGWLILSVGALILANTATSSVSPDVTGSDWSFALLTALISVVTARGLWLAARWAWWTALGYGVVGLFFLMPVTAAVVFGPTTEPAGTGWDAVLFPVATVAMVALLAALWTTRPFRRA
jgi:hypothetical protein